MDADGSGTLDQAELGKVFEMMGQNLNEKQLAKAFKMLDSDGSGSIDHPEFAKWWEEQKSISEEEMLHMVTHGECDGVLDLVEFEHALKEAGLDLERYPEMTDRLGYARARQSSRCQCFTKFEFR